jgi:hypothetical protein
VAANGAHVQVHLQKRFELQNVVMKKVFNKFHFLIIYR